MCVYNNLCFFSVEHLAFQLLGTDQIGGHGTIYIQRVILMLDLLVPRSTFVLELYNNKRKRICEIKKGYAYKMGQPNHLQGRVVQHAGEVRLR